MLAFVGLGLYDERSITLEGREVLRGADRAFAELYTSRLAGTTLADLEAFHGVDIERCDRALVERDPEPILSAAESGTVAFLTGGDPMVSTTHVDLRLRAHEREVDTRVVHGTTAAAAAASLTGLQNYRFGKATTLPFPRAVPGDRAVPASVADTIEDNHDRGLHTLVYLDIKTQEKVLASLRDQVQSAQANYEQILAQFEEGLVSSVDVVDAQTALNEAELRLARAYYTYQLDQLRLRLATGTFVHDRVQKYLVHSPFYTLEDELYD